MWKKLLLRPSAAGEITNESFTSSNGSTIRNAKTGRMNHSTTFRWAVWRNSGSFTDEIQTCQGTIGSPTPRWDVHKRAQRSTSGSRDEGVGGLHLAHGTKNYENEEKTRFSCNHDKAADPAPDEECTRPKLLRVRKTVQNRRIDLLATDPDRQNRR